MSFCDACPVPPELKKFVPPTGNHRSPKLYLVGMCPGETESFAGEPFCGRAGLILRGALRDAGFDITKDIRMFNVVNCRTTNPNHANKNRDPYTEEIDYCKSLVMTDIKKSKPEMIICLGKVAASAFIDISHYGSVREATLDTSLSWEGIPLRIGYHPSYILQNGGESSTLYQPYVTYFKQFQKNIPLVHLEGLASRTYLSADEFLETDFAESDYGFDIETSSLESLNIENKISGLGFCELSGKGYYVYLKTPTEYEKVKDKLRNIILTKKLYVFNFSFEGTAMAATLGVHPYEWNVADTRQTCLVVGKKGSLKNIASTLNFPNWEKSMDYLSDLIASFYKLLARGGKKESKELQALRISWDELLSLLQTKEDKTVFDNLTTFLGLYKDIEDAKWTIEEVREIFIDQASKKIQRIFYDIIPVNIVGDYCIFDAYAAIKIHHILFERMNAKEKRAVGYFIEHAELAASMECAGVGWNFDKAVELDSFYQEEMTKALKQLITLPLFSRALGLTTHDFIKVNSLMSVEELKVYFNPNSNHENTRNTFSAALDTPFVRKLYTIYLLYLDLSLTLDYEYVETKEQLRMWLRESLDKEENKQIKKEKFKWIQTADKEIEGVIWECFKDNQPKCAEYLNRLRKFQLPKFDEPTIIPLYEAFTKIGGIDVDDLSTWTPEFETLYYFRLFKKINKAFTSYLWGSVGMDGSARVVDIKDSELQCPPRRTPDWQSAVAHKKLGENDVPVIAWKFNVNGAETNRWRSGYHLWPWQCELQDLKISRYKNGLLAHCDYSQMEVRTIAAVANEVGLLNAYKEGKDVHRFMASKVFNKPEEEIEDGERRYSKMLTFSVLYGKTESGVARDFLHGDIEKAKELVNGFYSGFPKIAQFVKSQHNKVDKGENYVRSMIGEKINLGDGKHGGQASAHQLKRLAVNYPIQSTASHLTAIGINRVYREAFQRNLPIRAYGFTHDAGDFDFDASCLFDFLTILRSNMQDKLVDEFKIPVKIDIEFGVTGNNMLELKIKSIDENQLTAKFEGSKQALEDVITRLDIAGLKYDVNVEEEHESYMSRQALFMQKRAFSALLGKSSKLLSGIITINRGDI